jgi:hypothetical protein
MLCGLWLRIRYRVLVPFGDYDRGGAEIAGLVLRGISIGLSTIPFRGV